MPEPAYSEPLAKPSEAATPRSAAPGAPARARVLPMPVAEPSTTEKISRRMYEVQTSARRRASGAYRKMVRTIGIWLEHTRIRSRHVVDEYPLHVIGAVAITAFAVGIALRIRGTRHE
jgi:hypothetical protein